MFAIALPLIVLWASVNGDWTQSVPSSWACYGCSTWRCCAGTTELQVEPDACLAIGPSSDIRARAGPSASLFTLRPGPELAFFTGVVAFIGFFGLWALGTQPGSVLASRRRSQLR